VPCMDTGKAPRVGFDPGKEEAMEDVSFLVCPPGARGERWA